MDPLSEVLGHLRPSRPLARLVTSAGDWCVHFAAHGYIKVYAVLQGHCWIALDGGEPVALDAGDCVLLPGGGAFRLGSDLTLPPREPGADQGRGPDPGEPPSLDAPRQVTFIGGAFTLPGPQAALLLSALPPLIHLDGATGQDAVRWPLERMERELRDERPGSHLMAEHLAHLVLIQALRLHLERVGTTQVGWLFALSHPEVSRTLRAMHADPAHAWTVQALAKRVGLSRSTFAARFTAVVGLAPMAYLTRWRMLLAAERLASGEETVARIALSVGYESEAAFSTAFKRVMGGPPRRSGRPLRPVTAPRT
ncbi:AraC family transcriptional regulator [Deinococcus sonorensis]|uniref:AraC family transcriptional regulator n=2 Tax=Deinococcus sonorensis TaxID=309891 RepID=A0AAU7U5Q0_9DEIO